MISPETQKMLDNGQMYEAMRTEPGTSNPFFQLILLAGIIWLLAGCAPMRYAGPPDQASKDRYECDQQAHQITRGAVYDAYRDCMHARGYK